MEGSVLDLLAEYLREGDSVWLWGEGGGGKTTSLQQLVQDWAYAYQPGGRVCILAYLREYRDDNLLAFFTNSLAFPENLVPQLSREDLEELARTGRLELLLDGGDECPTQQSDLFRHLELFRRQRVPVVIGARHLTARDDLFPWRLRILPLTGDDQHAFAASYLGDHERGRMLIARLRETPGGQQLAESPICLSIICRMARDRGEIQSVSEGRGRLYREFFTYLYEREHCQKGREDLFPVGELEAVRVALARLFFGGIVRRNPPTRSEVVRALKDILGDHAPATVQVLLKWPLFEGRSGDHFDVRHPTYGEYLAAEHVVVQNAEGQRLPEVLQPEQTFVLACMFELAGTAFYSPENRPSARLIEACWQWDPLFVALAIREDSTLSRLPMPKTADNDTWMRGLLCVLQGVQSWQGLPETDLIAEKELSFPSGKLCARLERADLWEAGSGHELGQRRMERVWKLITCVPEPWADLLEVCGAGRPRWKRRVRRLAREGKTDETRDRFKMIGFATGFLDRRCFAPLPRPLRRWRRVRGQREDYIDDVFPPDTIVPEEWKRVSPRLFFYTMTKAVAISLAGQALPWMSVPGDVYRRAELCAWWGLRQDVRRRQLAFGYVLWFLMNRPWFREDEDKVSRREWGLFWRWVEDSRRMVDRMTNPFYKFPHFDEGKRPTEVTSHLLTFQSPSIAALLLRLKWAQPSDFTNAQQTRWCEVATFHETRSLLHWTCRAIDPQTFPVARRVAEWARSAIDRSDAYELAMDWTLGRAFPWAALSPEAREHLLRLLYTPGHARTDLLELPGKPGLSWDRFPEVIRRRILAPRDSSGQPREILALLRSSHVGRLTGELLAAIGGGGLHWTSLLPEEHAWLADPEHAKHIRQAVCEGKISLAVLRHAPPDVRALSHFQSILAAEEELVQEAQESLCHALGLVRLVCHRELVGGRSGSGVTRVFYQRPDKPPELGVLKQTTRNEDFERERDGHSRATGSWLSQRNWIPSAPQAVENAVANNYLLLSLLAFPPGDHQLDILSLHELVETGQRPLARRVVTELAAGYVEQLFSWRLPGEGETGSLSTVEHACNLLRKWGSLRRYWDQDDPALPVLLPPATSASFLDLDGQVRWNPLWLLRHPKIWIPGSLPLPRVFSHGDLNARNILVAPEPHTGSASILQMIDFEKAGESLLALDPCWLAFWLLMASQGQTVAEHSSWEQLPKTFLAAIFHPEQEPLFLGEFDLGLELVRSLFAPWSNILSDRESALRPVAQQTLRLTVTAAAVAKALLHERDFARRSVQEDRLWGVTFFRIAALAVQPMLRELPAGLPEFDLCMAGRRPSA